MAGDNPKGGGDRAASSSAKRPPPSPSSNTKSRWENASSSSSKPGPTTSNPSSTAFNNPIPNKPYPNPSPAHSGPIRHPGSLPHPPTYGFQMLDRRTIVLVDGSVRSYFALPPDYHDIPPPRFGSDRHHMFGPGGLDHPMKRKFEEEREREKQQLLHYGNAGVGPGASSPFRREEHRAPKVMKLDGGGNHAGVVPEIKVDPAIMKAFLHFVKVINENVDIRRNFLDNGRHGPLQCLACGRSSNHFPDVHSLVMHAHKSDNADSRVDHLGLHRALCALIGWNCMRAPDNSRMYQFLPADEAAAFQDDLIMWPPMVIIHNTNTGKAKDGRLEGLGNKAMDSKLRDLGFSGGKSKSLYNREGHIGITLIKFAGDLLGLKEAMRLSDHFEKDSHGRRDWAHLQSIGAGQDDENNPNLVMVDERTGEKRRILYGYLLTASDLDKVDHDTRKKVVIESKREKLLASI